LACSYKPQTTQEMLVKAIIQRQNNSRNTVLITIYHVVINGYFLFLPVFTSTYKVSDVKTSYHQERNSIGVNLCQKQNYFL